MTDMQKNYMACHELFAHDAPMFAAQDQPVEIQSWWKSGP
jgi:hypothetical protein